jgi:MscS family membrane protein
MRFLGLITDQWIDLGLSVLFVVGTALVGSWLVDTLLGRLVGRLTRRTSTSLDDAILAAVRPPLYWLIVLIVLKAAVARLDFVPASWNESLDTGFFILDVLVGFVFAGRLIHYLFIWYGQEMAARTETKLDEQLIPFFRRLVLVLLTLIGLITLLGRFVDVSALLTTLGVGSLAIALAAQAALSDTISGFLIMIDRPFRIGDRVEIQDLDTWGDVVDIGLRSTHIRTRDNRMVIIPNSVMGKSLIVNHSYPDTQYRIQVHIGVAYGSDLELARRTMIGAARGVEGVVPDRPVEALFLEFGDSALIFRVRWWIDSYMDTRHMFDRVNTAVYSALEEAGIELPNPQLDIHHRIDPRDADRIASLLGKLPNAEL